MIPQKEQINNEIKGIVKDMSFIIKKTYRVALAMGIISKCLLESDPFRISIRQNSQILLATTAVFHKKGQLEKELAFELIENTLLMAQNTLFVLYSSTEISEQNYRLIQDSVTQILGLIKENGMPFGADPIQGSGIGSESRVLLDKEWLAGREEAKQKNIVESRSSVKDIVSDRVFDQEKVSSKESYKRHFSEEKSHRTDRIIDFIKDKKEVSVKDIVSMIDGVSSKTIQRDLQELIDSGQIKQIGQKRWARYVYLR